MISCSFMLNIKNILNYLRQYGKHRLLSAFRQVYVIGQYRLEIFLFRLSNTQRGKWSHYVLKMHCCFFDCLFIGFFASHHKTPGRTVLSMLFFHYQRLMEIYMGTEDGSGLNHKNSGNETTVWGFVFMCESEMVGRWLFVWWERMRAFIFTFSLPT